MFEKYWKSKKRAKHYLNKPQKCDPNANFKCRQKKIEKKIENEKLKYTPGVASSTIQCEIGYFWTYKNTANNGYYKNMVVDCARQQYTLHNLFNLYLHRYTNYHKIHVLLN